MSVTVLNLILLFLGGVASLLAVGGDTWNKEAKWYRKLLIKGWIAAVLVLVIFAISVMKENATADQAQQAADKAETAIEDAKKQRDILKGQLENVQEELGSAVIERDGLKGQLYVAVVARDGLKGLLEKTKISQE